MKRRIGTSIEQETYRALMMKKITLSQALETGAKILLNIDNKKETLIKRKGELKAEIEYITKRIEDFEEQEEKESDKVKELNRVIKQCVEANSKSFDEVSVSQYYDIVQLDYSYKSSFETFRQLIKDKIKETKP